MCLIISILLAQFCINTDDLSYNWGKALLYRESGGKIPAWYIGLLVGAWGFVPQCSGLHFPSKGDSLGEIGNELLFVLDVYTRFIVTLLYFL